MPLLVLHADGSYDFSSSRGRWTLVEGKLHLSEAQFWGPGEIVGGDSVRFEYDYRGWRHTVTWTCRECASALQETGTHTQRPPMPPETPRGYPPPPPVTQDGMPDGRFPETPGVSAPIATPRPGSRSGTQEFLDSMSELGKALKGITKRGRDNGIQANPASDPPVSYQAAPSSYPDSPPPAFEAGQAASSYGATQGGQAAMAPPPPKCNPNIPKYSQPGCVE
jgi:hypothetical protein